MDPRAWKYEVLRRDGCVVHDDPADCELPMQAHHVITQQALRKRGLSGAAWDPRIGVGVCYRAHRRHTLAVERIPLARLPLTVRAFVHGLGLDWMLERYYA